MLGFVKRTTRRTQVLFATCAVFASLGVCEAAPVLDNQGDALAAKVVASFPVFDPVKAEQFLIQLAHSPLPRRVSRRAIQSDCDRNFQLNSEDIPCLQSRVGASDPLLDLTGDGALDGADVTQLRALIKNDAEGINEELALAAWYVGSLGLSAAQAGLAVISQAPADFSLCQQLENPGTTIGDSMGGLVIDAYVPSVPCPALPPSAEVCEYGPNSRVGLALVFKNGPLDFSDGRYQSPVFDLLTNSRIDPSQVDYVSQEQACLRQLGVYHPETGVEDEAAFTPNRLIGRYVNPFMLTDSAVPLVPQPAFGEVNQDFTIPYTAQLSRTQHLLLTQTHHYFFVDDYRNRFLTDLFIDSLSMPDAAAANVKFRQYLQGVSGYTQEIPRMTVREQTTLGATSLNYLQNQVQSSTWRVNASAPPVRVALGYDPDTIVGEYNGLVMRWVLGTPQALPSEESVAMNGIWRNNMLGALSDGINQWSAYRYRPRDELYRYRSFMYRMVRQYSCGDRPQGAIEAPGSGMYGPNTGWLDTIPHVLVPYVDEGNGRSFQVPLADAYYSSLEQGTINFEARPPVERNLNPPLNRPHCDQGAPVNNVMTFNEAAGQNRADVFPYLGVGYSSFSGMEGSDLAGMFVMQIFRQIQLRVGLSLEETDRLVWKTLSLMTWSNGSGQNPQLMPMRRFAHFIQKAARELWPDPTRSTPWDDELLQSVYEDEIRHVLLMRGIAVDARLYCSDVGPDIPGLPPCCPVAGDPACTGLAGAQSHHYLSVPFSPENLDNADANVGLGSPIPESHPPTNGYGQCLATAQGYTVELQDGVDKRGNPRMYQPPYTAYTFGKDSEYGPFDRLVVTTDDTLVNFNPCLQACNSASVCGPVCPQDLPAGEFCQEFTGRELSNRTLLLPGGRIRWLRIRERAPNEVQASYMEDTAPPGFRIMQYVPQGFSFNVERISEGAQSRGFRLRVVDPSRGMPGVDPETYEWIITKWQRTPNGVQRIVQAPISGLVVPALYVQRDQPVRIQLRRTRSGQTHEIDITDTVNTLDREDGWAFVSNHTG